MIPDIDPILADWNRAAAAVRQARDTLLATPGAVAYAVEFDRMSERFINQGNGIMEYLRRAQRRAQRQ
jgi:hypothetical protein